MKTATATLHSLSPYSQSGFFASERQEKERADEFEKRCWREKCHALPDGRIYIPPMAFKNCISNAASFLGRKIPGRRNATYTKHFMAGILVTEPLVLPERRETVEGEWFQMSPDGKRGAGSRVPRCFPVIREWAGDVVFYVLDHTITEAVFAEHLSEAGSFIGIGRFRPQNGGFYGRFAVDDVSWS